MALNIKNSAILQQFPEEEVFRRRITLKMEFRVSIMGKSIRIIISLRQVRFLALAKKLPKSKNLPNLAT